MQTLTNNNVQGRTSNTKEETWPVPAHSCVLVCCRPVISGASPHSQPCELFILAMEQARQHTSSNACKFQIGQNPGLFFSLAISSVMQVA
ncbi:hypothetical protein J6590_083084 [Homalodisca vitripennis]|nr:hypothetical protein J6590_083084 [Homalodisca vitripennis]